MGRTFKVDNLSVAKEILQRANQSLNPTQFYHWAVELGLADRLTYSGKTPNATFGADIYMDLKNNPNTIFEIVQQKPKLLIKLKNQEIIKNNVTETVAPKCNKNKSSFNEMMIYNHY